MTGDTLAPILTFSGAPQACAVCTILIGPGYFEAQPYRDPLTGWCVCSACLASLRRQRERDLEGTGS
jgi:hypothetical protein